MKERKTVLTCTQCGARLTVNDTTNRFSCEYCGAEFIVERSEGEVALKVAKQVGGAIRDVGDETRLELRRLQLGQQLSMLGIQLSNVQSEIRDLERRRPSRFSRGGRQLKELRQQEQGLRTQIDQLSRVLSSLPTHLEPTVETVPQALPISSPRGEKKSRFGSCLVNGGLGCLVWFMVASPFILLVQALWPGYEEMSDMPPLASCISSIGVLLGIVVAILAVARRERIYSWIRGRTSRS